MYMGGHLGSFSSRWLLTYRLEVALLVCIYLCVHAFMMMV
jgi:hypothetical protein